MVVANRGRTKPDGPRGRAAFVALFALACTVDTEVVDGTTDTGGQPGLPVGGVGGTAEPPGRAGEGPPPMGGADAGGSAGAAPACSEDALRCADSTVERCRDGAFAAEEECAFACLAGRCTGQCRAGDHTCDGPFRLVCNARGEWHDDEACPFLCVDGACTGDCLPGTRRCDGTTPQACGLDGKWVSGTACEFLCNKGVCAGQCKPGERLCSDKQVLVCDAGGTFMRGETCAALCLGGKCAGACSPGQSDCQGRQPYQCDGAGQWTAIGTPCAFLCSAGVCSGQCVPGTRGCDGKTPRSCDRDGRWAAQPSCEDTCIDAACWTSFPRTSSAPRIDGRFSDSEWPGAWRTQNHLVVGTAANDADLSFRWKARWNDQALFVLAVVTDDRVVVDSSTELAWRDDMVELMLDLDHSRGTAYDGQDDFQFLFRPGQSTILPGRWSAPVPAGLEFAIDRGSGQYTFEARLPWSSLGGRPGATMGFEIAVNDDDDGGDRDGKKTWHTTSDTAWFDPSTMASVRLGD